MERWTSISITGYADDTGAYVANRNLDLVLKTLEKEAKRILSFMASNRLIANEAKTELLIIRRPGENQAKVSIPVGRALIEESDAVKLLGLHIDNKLSWETHTTKVLSALNQRIGMLRHLRPKLTPEQLKILVNGLVYSKVRYGQAIFGRARFLQEDPKKKSHEAIQTALNSVMRLVAGISLRDHPSLPRIIRRRQRKHHTRRPADRWSKASDCQR